MQRLKPWLRSAGIVVSAALVAFALVMDLAGFVPDLDWRWVALGGFLVFAVLMMWRVRELQSDLEEVRGNQALELSIRGIMERGRRLQPTAATVEPTVLLAGLDEVRSWLESVEEALETPGLVAHFRGAAEANGDPIEEVVGRYVDGAKSGYGVITSAASVGTQPLNDFLEVRIQRLGEILFSLPGPASKVARLG